MEDGPEDARVRLLEAMVGYLEARHQNQLSSFTQIDQKVTVKITVCAGLVVVVGFLLPGKAGTGPGLVWWPAMAAVGFFVLCLVRTLWLALRSVEVTAALPTVQPDSFAQLAAMESPNVAEGLRGLVGSYLNAIKANKELMEGRKAPGDALVWWSMATLIASSVAVALLLTLYIAG